MAISRKGRLTFVHDNSQSCEHVQRYVILSGARSAQSRPRRERNVIIVHGRKTLSAVDLSAEFGLSSSLRSKRRYNPRGRTHSSALSFTKRRSPEEENGCFIYEYPKPSSAQDFAAYTIVISSEVERSRGSEYERSGMLYLIRKGGKMKSACAGL